MILSSLVHIGVTFGISWAGLSESYYRGTCSILLENTVVMDLWPSLLEMLSTAEPPYKRLVMVVCV